MTFTIEQIKNYLRSQDSLGDVLYNLSEKNILKANEKYKTKLNKQKIKSNKQETKSYTGKSGLRLIDGKYRENWNPDWQGDPDDPLRWKGW